MPLYVVFIDVSIRAADGRWVRAPTEPGYFLVNCGDVLRCDTIRPPICRILACLSPIKTHMKRIQRIKTAGHMRIETGRFLFELPEQTPCWMRLCCYIWIFRGKHRRWTNHRWLSALHRAACYPTEQSGTPVGDGTASGRFSLPVFFHPKQSQIIESFPSCVRSAAQRVNRYCELHNN